MRTALFAIAFGVVGLAACQPAAEDKTEAPAAAADADAATKASATAPMTDTVPSANAPATPVSEAAPPTSGSSATINPDGAMSNGAANPGSPPPIVAPDDMNAPKAN